MHFSFCFFRGLNIERVISKFLSIHCVTSDPSSISLVLVIKTTSQEEVSYFFVLPAIFIYYRLGLPGAGNLLPYSEESKEVQHLLLSH